MQSNDERLREVQDRIRARSDSELLEILADKSGNWTPEAVSFAKTEVEARGGLRERWERQERETQEREAQEREQEKQARQQRERQEQESPIPSSTASTTPNPSKSGRHSVMSRYTDAYLIARTITAFGEVVKVIAFATGGGIALISLVASFNSKVYIGGIIFGAIGGILIYVLGILVVALGQILKATLDTAVNTSPLLTKDEMREIMSLD
jgi:hypothetical protein